MKVEHTDVGWSLWLLWVMVAAMGWAVSGTVVEAITGGAGMDASTVCSREVHMRCGAPQWMKMTIFAD